VNALSAISTVNRFFYFRIPKAANTTLLSQLVENDPQYSDSEIARDHRDARKRAYKKIVEISPGTWKEVQTEYFKFVMVRHPVDRLVSAYRDKIARDKVEATHVAEACGGKKGSFVSFEEFVELLEWGLLRSDPHWIPQVELLPMPVERFDYIGKMEQLGIAVEYIMGAAFGSGVGSTENRTPWKTNSGAGMKELVDGSLWRKIRRLYERDFELLGYSVTSRS